MIAEPQSPREQVPSAERREEVQRLWKSIRPEYGVHMLFRSAQDHADFWSFLSALDAQSAERTRAEVEKMREALVEIKRVSIPKTYIHDLCVSAIPIEGTSR